MARDEDHGHGGTIALVAGAGVLAWFVLRGGGRGGANATPSEPCRLRLDSQRLTLDGEPSTTDDAIAACRASGHADVLITGDAIAGAADSLLASLKAAGVAVAIRKPQLAGAKP